MKEERSERTPAPLLSGFHFRGQLPHFKREGALYFVTFRLDDSLPASQVAKLKHDREALLWTARNQGRPLTWHEDRQLFLWYSDKVDAILDSGRGQCWLNRPDIGNLVATAVRYFDAERYCLSAWVVMPNHVHALVWPATGHPLSDILHTWKSYTARRANRMIGRNGDAFWQRESYEHILRDADESVRLVKYIEDNPVKAGLCRAPEDWLWSSARVRWEEQNELHPPPAT